MGEDITPESLRNINSRRLHYDHIDEIFEWAADRITELETENGDLRQFCEWLAASGMRMLEPCGDRLARDRFVDTVTAYRQGPPCPRSGVTDRGEVT